MSRWGWAWAMPVMAAGLLAGCSSGGHFAGAQQAQLVTPPHKILVVETYRGWKQFEDPLRSGLDACGIGAEFMNRENPDGGLFSGAELKDRVIRKATEIGADHVLEVRPGEVIEQTGAVRATYVTYSIDLTHLDSRRKVWGGASLFRSTEDLAKNLLAAMVRDGALPSCRGKGTPR